MDGGKVRKVVKGGCLCGKSMWGEGDLCSRCVLEVFTGGQGTGCKSHVDPGDICPTHLVIDGRVGVEDQSDDQTVQTQDFGENEDKDLWGQLGCLTRDRAKG